MSKIHERISKLLNMTVENGCSEDEQETAMRMAAGLAAQAGIDLEACRPKDAPKPKAIHRYKTTPLKPHQALAAQAAAELYGVECTVYNLGAHGINFVGREENIELAEQTMFWLMRQVELLYKQNLPKGLSQTKRAEYRRSFKAACALRVRERAIKLMREMVLKDEIAEKATGHRALVVQSHFKQLYSEIQEYWDERMKPYDEARKRQEEREAQMKLEDPEGYAKMMKERSKAKVARIRRGRSIPTGYGTSEGYEAGNHVQLRKELA